MSRLIAAVALVLVASQAGSPSTVAQTTSCEAGEALLDAGRLAAADKVFAASEEPCIGKSEADPSAPPAPGRDRVAVQKGMAAEAEARGLAAAAEEATRNEAIEYLAEAVRLDESRADAAAKLAELLADPADPNPYQAAEQLSDLGFTEQAKAAAVKAAEAEAAKDAPAPFPDRLRYLLDDPPSPFRDELRTFASWPDWARNLVVLTIIGLLLHVFLGWWRPQRERRQRRLELGEITDGRDGKVATPIKALIAEEIAILRREAVGEKLGYTTTADPKLEVPVEVVETVPYGKTLTGILSWIRTPPWSLTSSLQWDPGRGSGVALVLLTPRGRLHQQAVVWDDDLRVESDGTPATDPEKFDPAHARIGRAAAAWLAYSRAAGDERRRLSVGASATWSSYAAFRIGAEALEGGKRQLARAYFIKAVAEDPLNPGANFNLGLARLQDGPQPGESRTDYLTNAGQYFDRVTESLAACPDVGIDTKRNAMYYRLLYFDGVVAYEKADASMAGATWQTVVDKAKEAAKAAGTMAGRLDRDSVDDRNLATFLDVVLEASFALYGGALVRKRRAEGPQSSGSLAPAASEAGR